ncbi:MAG: hypothetical protein AB1767_10290 [Bacillota bacterium]
MDFFARERQSRLIIRPLVTGFDVRALLDSELPLVQITGEALRGKSFSVFSNTGSISPVHTAKW